MASTTQTTYTRELPEVEEYKTGLLKSAQDLVKQRAADVPPVYQVAGLSPFEQAAGTQLQAGIGGYQPYLDAASKATTSGLGTIGSTAMPMMQGAYGAMEGGLGTVGQAQQLAAQTRGLPYAQQQQALARIGQAEELAGATRGAPYAARQQAMAGLRGATGRFDPSLTAGFYDPYTEDVIQTQQADVARLGEQQRNAAAARAVAAGAFGGSRGALEQAEIGRNVLGEQSRIGAQLRSQGYQQAQQQAQQAFEAQQGRRMGAASGIGQMGLQYGQLGQQDVQQLAALGQARGQMGLQYGQLGQQDVQNLAALGQAQGAMGQGLGSLGTQTGQLGTAMGALGMQQAQLGEGQQRMNMADVQAMTQLGGLYRGNQQAQLDALRQTQTQAQQYPYQQLGFLADIYKSAPSSQYSILTQPQAPGPSGFQQAAGLGIAGLSALGGAKYAGLF